MWFSSNKARISDVSYYKGNIAYTRFLTNDNKENADEIFSTHIININQMYTNYWIKYSRNEPFM